MGRRDQLVADYQLRERLRVPEGVPGAGGVGSDTNRRLGGVQARLGGVDGSVAESKGGTGEAGDASLQARWLGLGDRLDFGARPEPNASVRPAGDRPFGLSGSVSSRIAAKSTEPTPSIMQWWVLVTRAQRPSASSRTAISQSGLVRSSRCEKYSPAHSMSSSRPPGACSPAAKT